MSKSAGNPALTHRELYDGSGYPQVLSGDDIPLESRIIRLLEDCYILLDKLEGQAMSIDDAVNDLQLHSGRKYDPKSLKRLIEYLRNVSVTGHE